MYKISVICSHKHVVMSAYPVTKQDKFGIEKVQRRFTKRLSGLYHLPYYERLRRLKVVKLRAQAPHSRFDNATTCFRLNHTYCSAKFSNEFLTY